MRIAFCFHVHGIVRRPRVWAAPASLRQPRVSRPGCARSFVRSRMGAARIMFARSILPREIEQAVIRCCSGRSPLSRDKHSRIGCPRPYLGKSSGAWRSLSGRPLVAAPVVTGPLSARREGALRRPAAYWGSRVRSWGGWFGRTTIRMRSAPRATVARRRRRRRRPAD